MRTRSVASALAIGLIAQGGSACARPRPAQPIDPVAQLTDGFDPSVRRDVEAVRRATEKFHDLAAAGEAGYPTKIPACIADSTMGGMGHHMIDRARYDEKLEIERPEMLLYAPLGNGNVELVAVEYVVPYQAVPATAQAPRLFGQAFKRYDNLNYWALHVWAWRRNPAGLFADWNPTVRC